MFMLLSVYVTSTKSSELLNLCSNYTCKNFVNLIIQREDRKFNQKLALELGLVLCNNFISCVRIDLKKAGDGIRLQQFFDIRVLVGCLSFPSKRDGIGRRKQKLR